MHALQHPMQRALRPLSARLRSLRRFVRLFFGLIGMTSTFAASRPPPFSEHSQVIRLLAVNRRCADVL